MSVPYDVFTGAFLSRITEYEFLKMTDYERNSQIDGFMKMAIAAFKKICKYDLTTTADDNALNTKDFSTYSPAELLLRISNTYMAARKEFTNKMREYSYNHGDLTELHLH